MAESSGKIVSNNANLQPENRPAELSESVEENKTESVMEPMLLEDYRVGASPPSIENLFKYLKQEGIVIDKNVAMVVFVYILMLESGFVTAEVANTHENATFSFYYKRFLLLTNSMPRNWKRKGGYTFSFILIPFAEYICKLNCIPVNEDLVINCCIRNIDTENFSLLLDPAMYVVNLGGNGESKIFQNLRGLSQMFKTAIGNSCKTLILEAHSVRPLSLQGMPPEIFLEIVKYCDDRTVLSLDKTCRHFKELCLNIKTEILQQLNGIDNIRQYCSKYLFMR